MALSENIYAWRRRSLCLVCSRLGQPGRKFRRAAPPAPQAIDFSQPLNLDLIKNRLVYYRCTQYDADVAKSLAEARNGLAYAHRK